MTLFQIISILKQIALVQPNVRTATDGSIYDKLNTNPSVEYDVVHIQQTTHQSDEVTDTYGFNIFYVSRLEDSLEDNRLQIQSIGKEVLDNILRTFCENWNIDYPIITYNPFTQRFNDLCAGVYCNVRIIVPKEIICADDYIDEVVPSEKDIRLENVSVTITENGNRVIEPSAGFDGIGRVTIHTEVPITGKLQYKEVEYTENGEYRIRPGAGYDGLSEVAVSVDVSATGDRYDEGYEDGERNQKAKLTSTSFTQNDTYSRADGWSSVTVNVDDRYEEGYEDGEAAQKAKLVSTSFTANNTYLRTDGWSSVTVNVPAVTAYTDQDLIANLQGDYFVIPSGTTSLRDFAFYNTCFSSITIPNTVTTIGDRAFANNTCLESIVIPDSVTNVGQYVFSGCTSLSSVTLGTGLTYLHNAMFSGDTALLDITVPGTVTNLYPRVFIGCSGLTAMTFQGLTPPQLYFTSGSSASLGSTDYTFPIYVPCQSLDAYKTAFGEYYAPRIQCKSSELISAITLNVASAITDSATATTTYSPATAYTDIYYTSSDPTIATIGSGTGIITAVSNGTVTICTNDRLSGLQDCKSVNVTKSHTGDFITAIYNVTSTTSPTRIMNATGSFKDAELTDGTDVPIATGFTFPTTGLNIVKYYIKKTTLDNFLFQNCYQLVSIVMPDSITSIGSEGCFYNCFSLSSVTLPSGITSLGDRTFTWNYSLPSITIPNSVRTIGERCFSQCFSLSSITIPSGVTSIASGDPAAFELCFMLPANFHNNSSLDAAQKQYWGLTLVDTEQADGLCIKGTVAVNWRPSSTSGTVTMPNTITEVGPYCFKWFRQIEIVWSSALTELRNNAFDSASITSITVPDTVQHIEQHCFNACTSLKRVVIGTGVTYIYSYAFLQCSGITSMTINASIPPTISSTGDPLGSTSYTFPIYVPGNSVPYYKSAEGWSPYADRVTHR